MANAKCSKGISNQMRLNSARFQYLLSSGNFTNALAWTETCKNQLDNSCPYGNSPGQPTPFEAWARFSGVNTGEGRLLKELFKILLDSNAHKNGDVSNLFQCVISNVCTSAIIFDCLLSKPDIFRRDHALSSISNCQSDALFQKCLSLTLVDPRAYEIINDVDVHTNENCLREIMRFGDIDRLQAILALTPLLELDIFANDRWISAEQMFSNLQLPNAQALAIIRCARENMEEYRLHKATLVNNILTRILPLEICAIVNVYNIRPE